MIDLMNDMAKNQIRAPCPAAWAAWMPARNSVERESPVIERDGRGTRCWHLVWMLATRSAVLDAAPSLLAGWPIMGRDAF